MSFLDWPVILLNNSIQILTFSMDAYLKKTLLSFSLILTQISIVGKICNRTKNTIIIVNNFYRNY